MAEEQKQVEQHADRELVAILDAGAQYAKVIDRRVRELCVESEILPLDTPAQEIKERYKAVIISGGPQSVFGEQAPKYDAELFKTGLPIFGICYGMQLLNHVHGGRIAKHAFREDGVFPITVNQRDSLIFADTPEVQDVLLTHGDSLETPAPGFRVVAQSDGGVVAAIEDPERRMYGVQFHPEVDPSVHGLDHIRNFLFKVAGLKGGFTMKDRKAAAVELIRKSVGDNQVLCLISGGVDSSVCSALLLAALPAEQIHCLHVDHGFMRKDESAGVVRALEQIGLKVIKVDAAKDFAEARTVIDGVETEQLQVTLNPEVKRKIIGDTFMHVSEKHIRSLGLDPEHTILAQGTLRPDLIESASKLASTAGNAACIKTHHNDTQLVRQLRDLGRVVEPLADYHKDEVRQLGELLGLPKALVWRQPFPGPGLAIRIICADAPFRTEQDQAIQEALHEYSSETISSTLLPCRTVGVQGDARTYSSLVALSCEDDSNPDWPRLFEMAQRIPRTIHGVNRVIFAFGARLNQSRYLPLEAAPQPQNNANGDQEQAEQAEEASQAAQGELDSQLGFGVTETRLQPEVVQQLQAADAIVAEVLFEDDLFYKLSQVPVVLFPVNFGVEGARAICIRTFITNDFMTGRPAMPGVGIPEASLRRMVDRILAEVPGISRVCYDLTSKPPATTEWE